VRGPVVFLLAVAAAGVGALLLIAPVWKERESLVRRIENRATMSSETDDTGERAAERLARKIGREGEPLVAVRGMALEYAPLDRIVIEGDRIAFPVAWSKMPELLGRLAAHPGLVFGEVTAKPEPDAAQGRLTLLLLDPERGIDAR
jgi:hypothetical protein